MSDKDTIYRQAAIDALDEIRHALWEIDIPSPTVPEYVEHHEQVQSVWKLLDKKQKELYVLQFAQPEQLERCPIYDGVCGYPSDQCYDCPRHHGAQPEQRWIPCGKCIHADGKHRWCKVLDRTINEDYFCYWAEPFREEGEA